MKGAGAQTCGDFLSAWDGGSRDLGLYAGWLDGYVTGFNQHAQGVYDVAPWQTAETLLGLMRGVCAQSPATLRFLDAFDALARRLLPLAVAAASPIEGAQVGDRAVAIYRVVLVEAQRALAAAGLFAGEADGRFGPATAEALAAFQRREGLEASGLPDQRTLFALLLRGR